MKNKENSMSLFENTLFGTKNKKTLQVVYLSLILCFFAYFSGKAIGDFLWYVTHQQ